LTNLTIDEELSQVKLALKILYEWAFQMTISDSDVGEEKQVIFSEYRVKQGLSQRLVSRYWPAIFGKGS
jgi:predicted Zn-dependent peptidase